MIDNRMNDNPRDTSQRRERRSTLSHQTRNDAKTLPHPEKKDPSSEESSPDKRKKSSVLSEVMEAVKTITTRMAIVVVQAAGNDNHVPRGGKYSPNYTDLDWRHIVPINIGWQLLRGSTINTQP